MRRFALVFALTLAAGVAGFVVHRALRSPPPLPPAPERPTTAGDRERADAALLTAGENALAKGQLAATKLALDSVPDDTVLRPRKDALAQSLGRALATRASDAGSLTAP